VKYFKRIKNLKHILSIALVLALISILAAPLGVLASNSASQTATTINTESISIMAQDYSTAVTSITFPPGWPNDIIANPHNNHDGSSPQSVGISSLPVVTLVNNNPSYNVRVYFNISAWSNTVVKDEYYLLNDKGTPCLNEDAINNAVDFASNIDTTVHMGPASAGADANKDLYLKVILGDTGNLSGTSTISILSEPYIE
jgi:hypothetical protein